jgi:outer membrane immunogenic protein
MHGAPMRKAFIHAAVVIAGIVTLADLNGRPAFAADMAVKARPLPAPVFSWTGFYAGAELGGEWTTSRWTTNSLVDITAPPFPITGIDASSPRNFNAAGVHAGGYFGYNWQLAPQWVGGVEVDFADANLASTTAGVPGCSFLCTAPFAGLALGPDQSSVKIRWDGSARARLGILATADMLVYGTGGLAWQNIEGSATCIHSGPDPLCGALLVGTPIATASNTFTRLGWTAGVGVDWHIRDNWIARMEYRYAQFSASGSLNLSVPGVVTTVGYQLRTGTNIATLGLAYKFGTF